MLLFAVTFHAVFKFKTKRENQRERKESKVRKKEERRVAKNGWVHGVDIFVLSPNVLQTAAGEPSRKECKVEPLGSATWRWQVGSGATPVRGGIGGGCSCRGCHIQNEQ